MRSIPAPRPGSPPAPRIPEPQRFTLANGLRVVALPRRELPHVAMRLTLPAGAVADPAGGEGTAALVAALLTEGTRTRTPEEINARLDLLGASLGAQVGHDFAEVDLSLLSETLAEGVGLLAEVIAHPVFPPREVERIRAETLDALAARADEPANVADDRVAEALFGPDHPYGRLATGTPDSVAAVKREQLADFHARSYRPGGSVLVAAGDFDVHVLVQVLEDALGSWTGTAPAPAVPPPARPSLAGRELLLPWEGAAQGEIRVAGMGLPRRSPRWVPAAVANYLLGGSTITGRLGANLREDKGWTYGVRSSFAAAVQPGGWVVDTAVDVEAVPAALAEIVGELERFLDGPLPEEELRRAKDTMILSLPRAFETPGRLVGRFTQVEAYGLAPDYWQRFAEAVEHVTEAEVRRLAHDLFHPERLVRLAVGRP